MPEAKVYAYILCAGSVEDPLVRSIHPLALERGWIAFFRAVAANVETARTWCDRAGVRFGGVVLQSILGQSASPRGQLEWDAYARVLRMISRGRLPAHIGSIPDLRRGLGELNRAVRAGEIIASYVGACDEEGALYEMSERDARRAVELQWGWQTDLVDMGIIDAAGDRELRVESRHLRLVENARPLVAAQWIAEKFRGRRVGIEPQASSKPGADWLGAFPPPAPPEVTLHGGEPTVASPLTVCQLEQTYARIGPGQQPEGGYFAQSVAACHAAGVEFMVLGQRGGWRTLGPWHQEHGVSVAVGLDVFGGRIG